MAKVSGKDTKPEKLVRSALFSQGFRFRKNDRRYPGKPDIVLPKYCTIVFVHGCFWHGHSGCKHADLPTSNTKYWKDKIHKNMERDINNIQKLKDEGWKVLVVWGCEIETLKKQEKRTNKLVQEIVNG